MKLNIDNIQFNTANKKTSGQRNPLHQLSADGENELSSLTRQCVSGRRFPAIKKLKSETTAWCKASNSKQKGVDWQFQIKDARIKLIPYSPNKNKQNVL